MLVIAPQFADYLLEIVAAFPKADIIHLVVGNLSSHRRQALVDHSGIGGLLWDLADPKNATNASDLHHQAEDQFALAKQLRYAPLPTAPVAKDSGCVDSGGELEMTGAKTNRFEMNHCVAANSAHARWQRHARKRG